MSKERNSLLNYQKCNCIGYVLPIFRNDIIYLIIYKKENSIWASVIKRRRKIWIQNCEEE